MTLAALPAQARAPRPRQFVRHGVKRISRGFV